MPVEKIDLNGKMVLPGLTDSHVHPAAAMTEFDHEIPNMESIEPGEHRAWRFVDDMMVD
jgi:predicted amidohydrolase YtcJ